ncbi:MAG: transporter [Bacteroidetes bacterium]|nr:transporter [Bacteroidota bacterium]
MTYRLRFLSLLFASLGILTISRAQTPLDGLMMPKGEICVALMYEQGTWDRYWEGSTIRVNQNIGTFTRQMGMPMIVGGITDKVNVILSLPYVKTSASAGQLTGAQGIQDLGLSVKAIVLEKTFGKGKLTGFTNLSLSTPASNYLSDYMPFSLGFGANELGIRGIGLYELDKGPYFRASYSYLHRGITEAERDFYYANGAYYTSKMDVPNAFLSQVTLGSWMFNKKLRVEASLTTVRSTSGDDIRVYSMPQPTNKVDVDRIEGFAQFYFGSNRSFGIIASYHHLFSGRNMGQFSGYGLGLTYQFKAIN